MSPVGAVAAPLPGCRVLGGGVQLVTARGGCVRPLRSLAVIINLIASTRTKTGLRVRAELDTGKYPLGVEVPEEDLVTIRLRKHRVHGEWNYTIRPRHSERAG